MKRIFSALAALVLAASLASGCKDSGKDAVQGSSRKTYSRTITVYMPIEYVDEGVLQAFEEEFQVGVSLEEFESNEEMYENLGSGGYDVLVPSDYMIDRLIQENRLQKLDRGRMTNLSYVAPQYLGASYDAANDYHVPYMVGTLGILYNRRTLQISSWQDLFRTSGVLLVDSERDIVGAALKMLGYSMNSTSDSELAEAQQALVGARKNIRGYYESTDIVDMITAQEAFIGVVYSGDGKTAVDLNANLAYIIPDEGSNKWTDAFCIPADAADPATANEFINFMCRPNIAIRNMSSIGYTSPIEQAWSEFAGNKIMFPSEEELARCETFVYSSDIANKYADVWRQVR